MLMALLQLDLAQVITCSDQQLCQQHAWGHNLLGYKSRLVMVKQ